MIIGDILLIRIRYQGHLPVGIERNEEHAPRLLGEQDAYDPQFILNGLGDAGKLRVKIILQVIGAGSAEHGFI